MSDTAAAAPSGISGTPQTSGGASDSDGGAVRRKSSDGTGAGDMTASSGPVSRASGDTVVTAGPTTTISTIAVQSGNTRIVLALLQSGDWLELRVVELSPGLVYLGSTLEEAAALQKAHHEVLTKLQSKQSPVEDLLNQADQLISTQRPRAEVYAAMAESLGLAWRDLNAHLETRKNLLDMSVTFHTRARQYSDALDAAEKLYTDNVMPSDAEGAKKLLTALHDHKRAILEASMFTLQEAHALLGKLKGLLQDGGSMDSRPQHIRTNIEFACSQIEHYLESLHDRRRFLDGLFIARKSHLEQCLALCLLYQDLTEAILNLKKLRDEISEHQDLGGSQANAEILLHEHLRRESAAKAQQDQCVRHVRTAEQMVASGHYAGAEARARAYSVLEAATALHETCDTRTALLEQSALFFRLANGAMTKLDQADVQVAALASQGGGNQRLSVVMGVVEESVQPALTEGYALLEVTGGRGQTHNQGVTDMVEQLENRRTRLSFLCAESTEKVLQRTELVNSFLEMYNSIESWLVKIGDSFLRGHQDSGGSLSLAKDFLHLHLTLKNDLMDKNQEIDTMSSFLEKLGQELLDDELASYKDKVENVRTHWASLKDILDIRINLSEKYVKFHEDAEKIASAFEKLEGTLKMAKGDQDIRSIEEKWHQIQDMYRDLDASGKDFIRITKEGEYPYLDVNRAALCIQFILENLGKRKLVVTDLLSHHQMQISINKELTNLWNTYKETSKKMEVEMHNLEESLCPLLRGDTSDPEEFAASLEKRLGNYVKAIKMIQEDIENMVTKAEGLAHSDDAGAERPDIVRSLLQLYQNLQNKVTDYQILGTMLIQWCKNIAEVHRSCDKLEKQFGGISADFGDVERQMKELDASKHAVAELLKFAQHEADAIIPKIRVQCPREAGAKDIGKIKEMLERRRKIMEESWAERQNILEKQLKRSQYQTDLKVIRDQLRDLSDQLSRMRGHYGDCLNAAMNMKSAFNQFKLTVEMLGRRIENFVSTAEKMLLGDEDAKDVQRELADLQNKWSTFHTQVGDSQKSIELSIEFFRLVREAELWFKDGSQLLVNVAGESSQIQSPDQAQKLQQKIESFLTPGEEEQANRITKITSLASKLFGDTKPQQVEAVNQQNQYMLDSFNVINKNLATLIRNLKAAEEQKHSQAKEQQELAASLAQAQAEAENARLAALAAEEARRIAEETVTAMAMHRLSSSETVEVIVQTDFPEPMVVEDVFPVKEVKIVEEEPRRIPPMFLTPLIGAVVTEGVKFTFECRVTGVPTPEVEWLKDNLSIMSNPDYKTSFDGKVCTLTIEETFTEDSALFTCKATNVCGTAESSANLSVKEAVLAEVMSPPLFSKRLVDSSAQEGSTFQLEATVTGHPLPIVSWWKDGACLDNSPDYNITYNNGECVLRFEELFQEDAAEYTCKATNDLGEDMTKAKLTVLAAVASEKPSFPVPLSNLMARAGQKFKLECEVSGTSTPSLAWFHNNKPVKETPECKITFDGKRAILVISEAFPKNAGKYTLVAKNTAGEAQTSSSVSVKGRIPTETSDSEITSDIDAEPVKPAIQQPLKDAAATEGETIRLDCIIIGQPEPEVIWYHDEKPVKESEDIRLLFHGDRCSLVIQEAFPEDIGVYKVVAMNSAGEASTSCHVNVLAPPEKVSSPVPPPEVVAIPLLPPSEAPRFSHLLVDSHVVEGGPVSLTATVSGYPKPTIAWFKDGIPLLPDDQVQIYEEPNGCVKISIPHTNVDHTGQYEVVASNSAGTAKCIGFLSIESRLPSPVPAEPQEPPEFLKLLEDTTVQSGHPVTFEAEVTGKPKPSVYWTLNDSPMDEYEFLHGVRQYTVEEKEPGKHSLKIAFVSRGLDGRLAIVAENDVGRAVSSCHLSVFESPPPTTPTPISESFERKTIISETHVTKIVSSSTVEDGPTQQTFTATSSSQVSTATGQPPIQVHGSHVQQVDQQDSAPQEIAEKVSLIKLEGDKVVEEVSTDTSKRAQPSLPTPKKIQGKRKATPARFISPLQGIILKENEKASFHCVIDGYPEPIITWSHNGGPLPEEAKVTIDGNRVSLEIPRVNQSHGGRYSCSLDNEAGTAQCTCDLVVRKIQFPPVFSKRLQPSVVGVGERLHLEIDVSGTPIPTISWSKNSQPLQSDDSLTIKTEGTRSWLVIQEAKESDSGRYGVTASNGAGRAECLADVMVTNLVISEPTKTIVFTDVSDDSRNQLQPVVVEAGHVKNLTRVIESGSSETKAPLIPVSFSKITFNASEQLTPSFATPIEVPVQPESEVLFEEKVERRVPGKLRLSWPPSLSEDENELGQKVDVDITKNKVSNIVSTFSALAGSEPILIEKEPPVFEPVEAKIWEPTLAPEPQPQYGYLEVQQPIADVIFPAEEPDQATSLTPDFNLEHNIQSSSEPETFDVDLSDDILSTPATSDYYPKTSPSVEVENIEKFQQFAREPEPIPEVAEVVQELTAGKVPEPEDMEFRTERHSRESSYTEIKKSMSTSEKTIVETKVYRNYPKEDEVPEVVPDTKTEEVIEYVVPESDDVIEFTPVPPEHTYAEVHEVPVSSKAGEYLDGTPIVSHTVSSTEKSSSFSAQESCATYVSSTQTESKIFPEAGVRAPHVSYTPPVAAQAKPSVFLAPERLRSEELTSGDESAKPPLPADIQPDKQEKKAKKKRASVKQIALKLEESIIPVSPDEVPGGIRMFPPKPPTPSAETPQNGPLIKDSLPASEDEIDERAKMQFKEFPKLEPFPFTIDERPSVEKPKLPPPPKPKKFIPGAFTDSEYESDFDASIGEKFVPKKIHFEAKATHHKAVPSSTPEPPPPSAFDRPPAIEGMRPEPLKKEEVKPYIEPVKVLKSEIPKKKPKIVQKFLAKAGEQAEHEITQPKPPKGVLSLQIESSEVIREEAKKYEREVITKKSIVAEMHPPAEVIKPLPKKTDKMWPPPEEPVVSPAMKDIELLNSIAYEEAQVEYQLPTEVIKEPGPQPPQELKVSETFQADKKPTTAVVEIPKLVAVCPEPQVVTEIPKPAIASSFIQTQQETSLKGFKSVKAPTLVKKEKSAPLKSPAPPFDLQPPSPKEIPPKISLDEKVSFSAQKMKQEAFSEATTFTSKQTRQFLPISEIVTPPWIQGRSQSLERHKVSVAPPLPPMPHEAPPAIYWSSNITLEEKRRSLPIEFARTTTAVRFSEEDTSYKKSMKTTQEETKVFMHKDRKESLEPKHVHIDDSSLLGPKKAKNLSIAKRRPTPAPHKVMPDLSKIGREVEESESVAISFKPIPQLEPFPFKVSDSKDRPRQHLPPPPTPKKFVPGSFTESDYESDYEGKPPSVWRPYMSDTESPTYKPVKVKLKQGRHKHPKVVSPPPPSKFDTPPQTTEPLRPTLSLSDLDLETPVYIEPLRMTKLECKFTKKSSSKSKAPSIVKPVPIKPTSALATPTKTVPFKPVTTKPTPAKPTPPARPTSAKPTPTKPVSNVPVPPASAQPAPVYEAPVTAHEDKVYIETSIVKGVHNLRGKFEGGQSPHLPTEGKPTTTALSQKHVSFTKQDYKISSESKIGASSVTSPASESIIIPVVHETFPFKPVSTKPLTTQMEMGTFAQFPREFEESGYTADTEATLPRKATKSQNYQQASASSTYFSKSESHASSFSSSRQETRSSQASHSGMGDAFKDFPIGGSGMFGGFGGDGGGGGGDGGGFPPNGGPPSSFSFPSQPFPPLSQTASATSSFASSESKSSQYYYTTKTEEEFFEKRPPRNEDKKTERKTEDSPRKPKFEEFRRETRGAPSAYGPFSEDTFYSMSDKSEVQTDKGKKKKRVEMKTESHVQRMSDKKSEYYSYSSGDGAERPRKESPKTKKKKVIRPTTDDVDITKKQERKVAIALPGPEPKPPEQPQTSSVQAESMKSISLVKQEMSRQEKEKELDLKPFPFKSEPEKTKKDKGPPSHRPPKFIKEEFLENDYESDYDGKISPLWKAPDIDTEEHYYSKVETPKLESKMHFQQRTPTSPSRYDPYPKFDDTPRPVVEFPDSEPEVKETVPKVIPKGIKKEPVTPKIVPKTEPIVKAQPPRQPIKVERSPSPVLQREPTPEEGYMKPPPKHFPNAVGIESKKTTKIEDSSQYHKRFMTMEQTTRVIKISESPLIQTTKMKTKTHKEPHAPPQKPILGEAEPRKFKVEEKFIIDLPSFEMKPMPELKPFPFTPEPPRSRKDRGQPPPMPKKFLKGETRASDYDSDSDLHIKPKWQPPDSDLEEPTYEKVKSPQPVRRIQRSKERTPTPPSVFDRPPRTGEPLRPKIDPIEFIEKREQSPQYIVPIKVSLIEAKQLARTLATREPSPPLPAREPSPLLPPPGTPPEEGVIIKKTEYVVDGVNVETKTVPPQLKPVPTFQKKPFREIIEKTERKITDKHYTEEKTFRMGKTETIKTTVTDLTSEKPKPTSEKFTSKSSLEEVSNLEPFPFELEPQKPRKERGPPPPQPKRFVKGEMRASSYDSDHDGRIAAMWKPCYSDVEESTYTRIEVSLPRGRKSSKSEERTPTPPSKFDKGPPRSEFLQKTNDIDRSSFKIEEVVSEIEIKVPIVPKVERQPPKYKPARVMVENTVKIVPSTEPLLPEPGPKPEIGYIRHQVKPKHTEEKPPTESKAFKKGIDIDIDVIDVYDYMSESESEKVYSDIGSYKSFPDLEPFPYTPEPQRPKRERGQPPPMPKKFMKGEFKESDYDSDYDGKIPPKWGPTDSEGESLAYRKVKAPSAAGRKPKSEGGEKVPSPPSKFDHPPSFEGPPRPVVDFQDIPRRERRESLEEYSIPKFPKVEFKPFDLDDDEVKRPRKAHTIDTGMDSEASFLRALATKKYAESTQKFVGDQLSDMNQTFRTKAQKFAEQLVSEVFAAKDESDLNEPAGEPSLTEDLKASSREEVKPEVEENGLDLRQPQAYRDESRVSEFGSKHLDPDTGLIYFKYDFGYEFGIVFPGEAKKVERSKSVPVGKQNGDIEIPVIHVRSDDESSSKMKTKSGFSRGAREQREHKGRTIPKAHTQFKPITGAPLSDSETESHSKKEVPPGLGAKIKEKDPKSFAPFAQGASSTKTSQGPDYQLSSPSLVSSASAIAKAPAFIMSLRDYSASVGSELRLECVVRSLMAPEISWHKDGVPLAEGPRLQIQFKSGVCRLILSQLQPEDSGFYTCTAENSVGKDSTSSAVTVAPGETS